VSQARTWLVVLTAFLVELVAIAAVCNQGLSSDVEIFAGKHQNEFFGQVAEATQVYAWRFTPKSSDHQHLALSQFALLATLFVLTAGCVFALARGAVTFGRAFVGVWLAVIVATDAGAVVRNLVADVNPGGVNRFTFALFAGPSGYAFVAGLGLGFLTALIAALVAVASRRPAAAPVSTAGWDAPSGGFAAAPAGRSERDPEQDTYATTQYPVYPPPAPVSTPLQSAPPLAPPPQQPSWAESSAPRPEPSAPAVEQPEPASDKTTQIPRVPPASDDPDKTTMLPRTYPRPPNDEDLGHQPE
jgi:hypothetical protein